MHKILFLSCFLFLFTNLNAQRNLDSLSGKELRKSGPKYIGTEAGMGFSSFRDLATSPLTYIGFNMNFRLSFLKENARRERQFYMLYSLGFYTDDYSSNASKAHSFFIDYSKLYRIQSWSNEKWNTKAGGKIDLTGNVRNNPGFQNNAFGVEFFGNIMGSIQTTKDISRKTPEPKKLLFINYGRKAKTRFISGRFNTGIINTNYRNGYIYTQQYQVVNKIEVFENYKFRVNGLRFGTTIAFTRFFDSGNGIRFSYNWDAYRTSYKFDGFDMAYHTLSFALLFRTK